MPPSKPVLSSTSPPRRARSRSAQNGQGSERLPQDAELGRNAAEVPAQRLVDESLPLPGRAVGERLHRRVGERVPRAEEGSHPIDPRAETAAGLFEVDEAGGEHDVLVSTGR